MQVLQLRSLLKPTVVPFIQVLINSLSVQLEETLLTIVNDLVLHQKTMPERQISLLCPFDSQQTTVDFFLFGKVTLLKLLLSLEI